MTLSKPYIVTTRDSTRLSAARFTPKGEIRCRLVVAGATGVPQYFYAPFATHAAGAGFEVVTVDFRGIGQSKHSPLRGFKASLLDWGQLDLAAVIDSIPDDGLPLALVGHSFGGHALGMLPNHERLHAAVICGGGAGWAGWSPPMERIRLAIMWNVIFPPLVYLKGYMPMRIFKMGEDLPLGVYQQWKHWCTFPRYFLDDPEAAELVAACAKVTTPILAVTALDDAWAPPRSRDAFLVGAYPKSTIENLELDPKAFGSAIGHVGYFRRHMVGLWDQMLSWVAK